MTDEQLEQKLQQWVEDYLRYDKGQDESLQKWEAELAQEALVFME